MVKETKVKEPKPPKRPSDFEIVRTIFQRTHERKLPYVLKNMGEDDDIYFLCSQDEDGFTYGSSDMAIAIIEILDDELKTAVQSILSKLYGFNNTSEYQFVINLRDQLSELSKNKGESISCEVSTNEAGAAWVDKSNINDRKSVTKFVTAIESLYHFQMVKEWCSRYRRLLSTNDDAYLYYEYRHPPGDNSTILKLDRHNSDNHRLVSLYPNGFKTSVSRGMDVIIDKFLEKFPYPVEKEEMVIYNGSPDNHQMGVTTQLVHRIQAVGWRMILVRPNAFFFPTLSTDITNKEGFKDA